MGESETKSRVILAALIVVFFVGFVMGYKVCDQGYTEAIGFHH